MQNYVCASARLRLPPSARIYTSSCRDTVRSPSLPARAIINRKRHEIQPPASARRPPWIIEW